MENNVILKPFEIDGSSTWVDAKRRTLCVLRIFPDEMSLEVKVLKGCDPNVDDVMNFILDDKDVRLMIRWYQQRTRKDPFAIRIGSGMSGRRDIFINFYDEYGLQIKGKRLLHISCYDKIYEVKKIWIGDFVEMIYACNFRRFKSTGKYVKPYLAPDDIVGTEVHKII